MNNLKFFICAVGKKIVGLFKNSRRNVVEMSTSEFLDVYSRMSPSWFCFVVRDYIREGDRWWHLSTPKSYADDRYWRKSTMIVHSAFRDAYPEVFLHRLPTREGTVYSWLNRKNETVVKFLGNGLVLERTTFRIELLKMLISEYGDRKLCFNIRSGK